MTITPEALIAAAQTSKAWPFQEAQRLAKRMPEGKPGGVLFETGYGPSGLPHIGTFQEVLRTTLVRRAYEALTGGAALRLEEITPKGHEARIHLTLTDDHPWAQAFVIIEARPL